MKKTMKTLLLTTLLTVACSFSFHATAHAEAVSGTIVDDFTWSFDSDTDTLTISGEGALPTALTDYPVGSYWQAFESEIQHVIIEDTITDFQRVSNGLATGWGDNLAYLTRFSELPSLKSISDSPENGYAWKLDLENKSLTIGSDSFQTGFLEGFDLTSINQLTLSDDVTLCPDLALNGTLLESVTIGKNLQKTDNLTKLNTEEFVVDSKNKYFASYNESLYTKDLSKLICSKNLLADDLHAPSQLCIIGPNAINNGNALNQSIIIPWGVTTLDEYALLSVNWDSTIIFPDTLTNIEGNTLSVPRDSSVTFIYSSANTVIKNQTQGRSEINSVMLDSVAQYYPDHSASVGLVTENGKVYIYDEDGNMLHSGWYQADGNWYYLNDNGAGVVNCWRLKDGKYVYLGADGKMKTNCWIKDYGDWYYVDQTGARYESRWGRLDNAWYWFGGSGKMMSNGWLKLADGKWYYFRSGGQMATGWIQDGGKWYYLNGSGAMAANKWVKSGSYWYYLGSNGAMLTNTITPDGYRVDSEGRWV